MRHYSYWQALILAFFSPSLYRDVAQRWRGTGYLYLFFTLALCWLALSWNFYHQSTDLFKYQSEAVIQQVPDITIKQGVVSINKPLPYQIINPVDHLPIVIFMTNTNQEEIHTLNAPVIIAKDGIIIDKPEKTFIYTFNNTLNLKFTQAEYRQFSQPKMMIALSVAYYSVGLMMSFLYHVVIAIFFAFLLWMISRYFIVRLSFQSALRITCVALTPLLIFTTISQYYDLMIPYMIIVDVLIVLVYLFFALYINQSQHE